MLATVTVTTMLWLVCGCRREGQATTNDDISVLVNSDSPKDRLAASKRLAAQGESVIPAILEAFNQADGKAEAQSSLADAVFRMAPSKAQIEALAKMAEQTKDAGVRTRIEGLARQRKLGH